MKLKTDFVTNSSSSSFVIFKKDISELKQFMILNHNELRKMMEDDEYKGKTGWSITETDDEIRGYTGMDNFDMFHYLVHTLHIDENVIKMEHS